MQNVIKKIKVDDSISNLFLSPLFKEKYQVPVLDSVQQKLIADISKRFLISGFILNSCDFNLSHQCLVEQLKYQRRIYLLKQMLVKNDLINIARNLNKKGVEHVFLKGAALNADELHPSGMRFSRDLDLLVRPDLLDKAYDVLKNLGFKYLNPKTQDSTKYHYFGLHFPPMINENNTKVELHWRVTSSVDFKNCPFMENILVNRRISNTNPLIFCPQIEITLAHLLYHSFEQHRLDLGPIFLFDLAAIFNFFDKKWRIDESLHKKLGIEKQFDLCKRFIENVSIEPRLSFESNLIAKEIFEYSHWLRLSDESHISSPYFKTTSVETFENHNFFERLSFKILSTRTNYQVSYYSVSYWVFLVSDILAFIKKVMSKHLVQCSTKRQ